MTFCPPGPRHGHGQQPLGGIVYVAPRYAEIRSVRRMYLRKSQELFRRQMEGLALAYLGKLAQVPGTPLPAMYAQTPGALPLVAFPFLAELARAHYTMWEDLDGASNAELMLWVRGIGNLRDAQRVLSAWASLPPVTLLAVQPTTG